MLGSIVSIVLHSKFNSFTTEAEDWFLYDNGLRHERVKEFSYKLIENYCWLLLIDYFVFLVPSLFFLYFKQYILIWNNQQGEWSE